MYPTYRACCYISLTFFRGKSMKQNHIIELDMCEINAGKKKYYESKVEPK